MKIINLEEKLQKKLIENFDETKPYTFFFINYGRPSQMNCKLIPSENNTIFITIANQQQRDLIRKTRGNINITYSAWSDECDTPSEQHAVSIFYKNERTINSDDDIVETMIQMIQEILDAAEQDN
jgi:hypothetical protein